MVPNYETTLLIAKWESLIAKNCGIPNCETNCGNSISSSISSTISSGISILLFL